jgi:hypothetical protein
MGGYSADHTTATSLSYSTVPLVIAEIMLTLTLLKITHYKMVQVPELLANS